MPQFCLLYAGDILWGAMFFVLYGCCFAATRARRVWVWAAATTVLIEVSQLWRPSWLVAIRATTAGKLLLGDTFLWSDLGCVVLGATVAALVDEAYWRRRERTARAPALNARLAFVAWFAINVASAGLAAFTSYSLRPPPESWGKSYDGGPGDGFVYLLFIALPAFVCLIANLVALVPVVRAWRDRASTAPAIAYLAVVLSWLRVAVLDHYNASLAERLGS
jgi:hypothetical protein